MTDAQILAYFDAANEATENTNEPERGAVGVLRSMLETAVALAQGAALSEAAERYRQTAGVYRSIDGHIEPYDTEQEIRALNPTAIALHEQAVAREVGKARMEMQEGIARVFDSYGPDVPKAKEAAALVRSLSLRPSRAIPASGVVETELRAERAALETKA